MYTPRHHYTSEELDNSALRDLLSDAEQSEQQAINGPFFPEKGVTREMLLTYAAKCRKQAEQYKISGARKAILAS